MALHPIRTVVAVTIKQLEEDGGYIAPIRRGSTDTQTKVTATLRNLPDLDTEYYDLADEIISFFKALEKDPQYSKIMERADAPQFRACIDASKETEVSLVNFAFVVQMPHLYGLLQPKAPKVLNALTSEAKLLKPGEFMGKLNEPDRFFVKLVRVGDFDRTRGGNLFEVRDRNENIGFFYERPDKLEDKVQLGDCFAMHATPSSHRPAPNGEKHTIFRTVEIVENKGQGLTPVDATADVTGKFVKNVKF